ncbi:MAG: hypothetical protein WCD81_03940 [Candidatus Bathyarchaeia archaeon]
MVLVFFLSLGIGLVPKSTCQNTDNVDITIYPNISDIDFKNGIVTFSNLYLEIDANESFAVGIFTTALQSPSWIDNRATYDNKTGLYSLNQEEFPNGRQLKFSLKEDLTHWTLINDRLECGIAIGLNITSSLGVKNVYPGLNFPLQDNWNVTATITEATPAEASQYALYGMHAINQSISSSNLTQFYVIKIDVIRISVGINVVYWIPLLFMLALLFASLKLVRERDLENSLLVYISVDIFGFGYLLTLMNITPSVITSIDILTLVDVSLSFVFSIWAIFRHPAKGDKKKIKSEKVYSETQNKNVKPMGEEQTTDEILKLIRLVDNQKDKLFRARDLIYSWSFIFLAIFVLYLFVEPILLFSTPSSTDKAILTLSFVTVIVAILALIVPFSKETIILKSFKRLEMCVEEDKKPLLKALIKIKSKNNEFCLEQIYNMDKGMFTKEELIKRLYE